MNAGHFLSPRKKVNNSSYLTSAVFVVIVLVFFWFMMFWHRPELSVGEVQSAVPHKELTLEQKMETLHQLAVLRDQTYVSPESSGTHVSSSQSQVPEVQADAADTDAAAKLQVLKSLETTR